jgi:F-type H+-transporting ATPase subunit alpha
VNVPLHTGIKAIDAMIPIGRGQRELIIGDRGTGKTAIAIDTILNQKSSRREAPDLHLCRHRPEGIEDREARRRARGEGRDGVLDRRDGAASAPAALQFLAPFAGATIGEYFMEQGKDALVVYDDLSKQAVAYRQMSLLFAARRAAKRTRATSSISTRASRARRKALERRRVAAR